MSIFLITGASGTGKTSLAHELKKYRYWDECISHTTRPMRDGEVDGETYYFVNKEVFTKMHENGEFAEHVTYHGNYYGISHAEINRVMGKNKHVFIIVEYGGYLQIKEQYPNAIGIYIWATKEDCVMNMLSRGDSIESANERISTYEQEIAQKNHYDYVIRNVRGKFRETVAILANIINQYE
jgi:guanylate kinase